MNEALLLDKVLHYLGKQGSRVTNVDFQVGEYVEVVCKGEVVKFETSFITNEGVFESSLKQSSFKSCFNSYKSYFKKHSNSILLVREGLDSKGNVVYVKYKSVQNSIDSVLLELSRECDRYSSLFGFKNVFVYDSYGEYVDIYPLSISEEFFDEEEISLYISKKRINCSSLYEKFPKLRGIFDEGLLRCVWSIYGDYSIVVKVLKNSDISVPFMYTLYSNNGVDY